MKKEPTIYLLMRSNHTHETTKVIIYIFIDIGNFSNMCLATACGTN